MEEEILAEDPGLPSECDPEGLTWFWDYQP
jgi:hypothetical protein